ncbi:hypothetical protein NLJ89_g8488 [Agrocybe chaxingu]|uniref:Uncharacterized protein n=1 Tax=Agrocybe chaxingu TaxID=84603 RepID=A0A9W8JUB8_9AGAR|nr:hypothetical protein NLJ89_g8488 [Agrocybe chaxingu]
MHTEQARFPNLRSLTLAPAHPDAFNDALPVASVCFPHIETLILANLYPPEFEALFVKHSRVLFPQLKDLALTGVEKVVARLMPEVARFRASRKAPLRNVFIDGESICKLTGPPEIWGDVKVKKGDLWEAQRRKGLYSNIKDLFVGRPLDEH